MPARSKRNRWRPRALAAAVVLAWWLIIRWSAATQAAAFYAGFLSGFLVCILIAAALQGRAERMARKLGTRARTAVRRPVPRVPKPASTPIHDEAARRQNGG